jgi:hypothetical protein
MGRRYSITSAASTHERGYDIVAHQNGKLLVIEAKGATSSQPGTKDYGNPWDKGKLSHSLAQAILRAMETIADYAARSQPIEVGIALPDVQYYRGTVRRIHDVLAAVGIKAYLVSRGG